ncbi:MAG TPA: insulinase family protein, partial [Myxococcales bacterium]|nr:insulinase family protein [Myxococcales bacterium]
MKAIIVTLALLIAAPAATAYPVPKVERLELANGLTVMLREDHAIPLVTIQYLGRAGSILDAKDKAGTALLAARILTGGTPGRSEEEIVEKTERLGATLSASAGKENFSLKGSVTTIDADSLEKYLELFTDVLFNPIFPQKVFVRERNRILAQLQGLVDDRSALAGRAFYKWVYGNAHPYGRSSSGTPRSIKRITRDDLLDFHADYVLPDNAVIAVAGDFDPTWMKEKLTTLFGSKRWGRHACPRLKRVCVRSRKAFPRCKAFNLSDGSKLKNPWLKLPKAPKLKGVQILLLDTEDATLNQVQIRMGAPIRQRLGKKGWYAHSIAGQILGGDFSARLNKRLRVKEGLTYGARYRTGYDDQQSSLGYMSTFTSPKDLARAIKVAREEITRFLTKPIPDGEIEAVKQRITRGFVFRFETASKVLGEYLDLWLDQLPDSHLS